MVIWIGVLLANKFILILICFISCGRIDFNSELLC